MSVNAKFNLAVTIDDSKSVVKICLEKAEGIEVEKLQSLLKVFSNINKSIKRVMDSGETVEEIPAPAGEKEPETPSGIVVTPIPEEGEEQHDGDDADA